MKTYLYGAIALASMSILTYTHIMVYNAGKQSILAKLANDRITVLEDGKKIDESVLSADDNALVCMLTDCGDKAL